MAEGSIVVEGKVAFDPRRAALVQATARALALVRSCNGRIEWVWEGGH